MFTEQTFLKDVFCFVWLEGKGLGICQRITGAIYFFYFLFFLVNSVFNLYTCGRPLQQVILPSPS